MAKHGLPKAKDALDWMIAELVGDDPARRASFREAGERVSVAAQLYCLRKRLGLSQRELAARAGTQASVICKMERATYRGHSVRKLEEIAEALDARVVVLVVPSGHTVEVKPTAS